MKTSKTLNVMLCALFVLSTFVFGQQQWNGAQNATGDISRNGRVGIGLDNPARRLHVNGDIDDLVRLSRIDGSQVWDIGVGKTVAPGTFFIARPGASRDFSIDSNGRVGIGIITPSAKLHIFTTKSSSSRWQDAAIMIRNDNYGDRTFSIYHTPEDHLRIGDETAANSRLEIDKNGNVGIGTTAPARRLHLSKNTDVEILMEQSDAKTDFKRWNFVVDGGSAAMPSRFYIRQLNDAGTSGNVPFAINGNGNVGIGMTSPAAKLHVLSVEPQTRIESSGDRALVQFAKAGALQWDFGVGTGAGNNDFWFGDFSAYRMVLQKGTGNVGIGTTNPGQKLHVLAQDAVGLLESTTNAAYLRIQTNEGTSNLVEILNRPGGNLVLSTGRKDQVNITKEGSVGIGTTAPQTKLDVAGITRTQVLEITGGSDLAEPFEVSATESIKPGMVVAIDSEHLGRLRIAHKAYDRTVAGIISGANGVNPGLTMKQEGSVATGSFPVSLTGRVYCWADASFGAIEPGDLLTTSDTFGHAMKVTDYAKAQGAIIGKAMSSLESGKGLVWVLVTLQ